MFELATLFGLLGGVTSASIFFPQVYRSWKTKRTNDLSWPTIGIGLLCAFSWVAYGLLRADPFIWVTNLLLFTASALLALLKKLHG